MGDSETLVVLFYRYEGLGDERAAALAGEQRGLGAKLGLRGRVLVAPEGINGTVQGDAGAVAAYEAAVERAFPGGIDWKRSKADKTPLFPDFAVKEVPELVSFGIRTSTPLDVRTEAGIRASPAEFHQLISETPSEDLRVVDVRNTFEYEVGHFRDAVDPGMAHSAQWPRYVNKNLEDLRGRTVLLYCTGGIRCEKASAYLQRRLQETAEEPAEDGCQRGDGETAVHQLEGGIHRYLEAFPDGGHFQGANFVFDRRAQMRPTTASGPAVGRCSECRSGWDVHHGGRVCCVCRALVLVCDSCDAASEHGEYYCADHEELRGIYFHFVDRFDAEELERQRKGLREKLAGEVGTRRKNRRATLRKKAEQVEARLGELQSCSADTGADFVCPPRRCRACERPYCECPGACWGFWKRDGNVATAEEFPSQ